jgi:hypothetical protein
MRLNDRTSISRGAQRCSSYCSSPDSALNRNRMLYLPVKDVSTPQSAPLCSRDPAPLWLSSAQARLSFSLGLLRSAHPCSPHLPAAAQSQITYQRMSSFSKGPQICPGSRIRAPYRFVSLGGLSSFPGRILCVTATEYRARRLDEQAPDSDR